MNGIYLLFYLLLRNESFFLIVIALVNKRIHVQFKKSNSNLDKL